VIRAALVALLLSLSSAAWQYPPEYQPKQPYGAVQPPKNLTGNFVCGMYRVRDLRTPKPFEIAPLAVPGVGPQAAFRFLLRPDGAWVNTMAPNLPLGGRVVYKNGVAHLLGLNGAVLYSYMWRRDPSGTEYLVQQTASARQAHVCRSVR
jgi:hypothetical protein